MTSSAQKTAKKPLLTLALTPRDRLILALIPALLALLLYCFHLRPALADYRALRAQFDSYPPPAVLETDIATARQRLASAQTNLNATRAALDARRADLPANLPPDPVPPPLDRLQPFNALLAQLNIQVLSASQDDAQTATNALSCNYTLLATYPQFTALLATNAATPGTALPLSFGITSPLIPGLPAHWSLHLSL